MSPGTLYVCGTPLGNLADLSERALATLRECDLIAAEDTRQIAKICSRFGITTPTISYHEHNEPARASQLIMRLQAGARIALVSDAGMPGIADPGEVLIREAIAAGLPVIPVPGPVAAITALVISGLPTERWVFEGFLPREGKQRRRCLRELTTERRTLVFYEGPHRLLDTLKDMATSFGAERPVAIARELTKIHEETWRGSLQGAIAHFEAQAPRGEFTLVVGGATSVPEAEEPEDLDERLAELLATGIGTREASARLAQELGLPRKDLYRRALALGEDA